MSWKNKNKPNQNKLKKSRQKGTHKIRSSMNDIKQINKTYRNLINQALFLWKNKLSNILQNCPK